MTCVIATVNFVVRKMGDLVQVYTNNKDMLSITYEKLTCRLFHKQKKSGDIVWRWNVKSCSVMVTKNSNIKVTIKQIKVIITMKKK